MTFLDEDGYPTEETLDFLTTIDDQTEALDFLKSCWHWPDFASHDLKPEEVEIVNAEPTDRFLRCATGGWSGNESLIEALRRNKRYVWFFTWQLSARGGLHIFKYPE